MRHRGFRATVTINGVIAHELQTTREENRITCYIPSESRKRFVVSYESVSQRGQSPPEVNGLIYLDGDREAATEGCLGGMVTKRWRKGSLCSNNQVVPFAFAEVTTTDDDSVASPDADGSKIGQIVIKLCRGNKAGRINHSHFRQAKDSSQFHERSLKKTKISHATVTGKPMRICHQRRAAFHYYDTPSDPHVEFVFLYRSRAVLLAMGAYGGNESATPEPQQANADYIPLVAARPRLPVQANAEAGSSRRCGPPARPDRQCAPSPSARGSVGPARSVTFGRSPSPTVSDSSRREELPIDVETLCDEPSYEDVKPKYRQPQQGDRGFEIDITDDDDASEVAESERLAAEADAEELRIKEDEIAVLKARVVMLKQKAREQRKAHLSKARHVSPQARYQSVGCSVSSGAKQDKGKAKAPPIEVVDLTGDDD